MAANLDYRVTLNVKTRQDTNYDNNKTNQIQIRCVYLKILNLNSKCMKTYVFIIL